MRRGHILHSRSCADVDSSTYGRVEWSTWSAICTESLGSLCAKKARLDAKWAVVKCAQIQKFERNLREPTRRTYDKRLGRTTLVERRKRSKRKSALTRQKESALAPIGFLAENTIAAWLAPTATYPRASQQAKLQPAIARRQCGGAVDVASPWLRPCARDAHTPRRASHRTLSASPGPHCARAHDHAIRDLRLSRQARPPSRGLFSIRSDQLQSPHRAWPHPKSLSDGAEAGIRPIRAHVSADHAVTQGLTHGHALTVATTFTKSAVVCKKRHGATFASLAP